MENYLCNSKVTATDGDAGSFGELEFSFSEEDNDKPFRIETIPGGSGRIYTTRPLDYERAQEYTLTIVVEDLAAVESEKRFVQNSTFSFQFTNYHAYYFRFDTANLTVEVVNLNDNPPIFVRMGRIPIDSLNESVLEEIAPPHTVTRLQVQS